MNTPEKPENTPKTDEWVKIDGKHCHGLAYLIMLRTNYQIFVFIEFQS